MDVLNDDSEKSRLVSSKIREEDLRPRSESALSDKTLLNMSDSETDEKRRSGDLEKDSLAEHLPKVVTKEHATKDPYARAKILMWMLINTLATVTIVSCHLHTSCHVPDQCMLTTFFCTRSSAIKLYSATNPFHNVKQPSQPSTSS